MLDGMVLIANGEFLFCLELLTWNALPLSEAIISGRLWVTNISRSALINLSIVQSQHPYTWEWASITTGYVFPRNGPAWSICRRVHGCDGQSKVWSGAGGGDFLLASQAQHFLTCFSINSRPPENTPLESFDSGDAQMSLVQFIHHLAPSHTRNDHSASYQHTAFLHTHLFSLPFSDDVVGILSFLSLAIPWEAYALLVTGSDHDQSNSWSVLLSLGNFGVSPL